MTEMTIMNDDNEDETAREKLRRKVPHKKKTVAELEARLGNTRLEIAALKEQQIKEAERARRTREQAIGRIMLELIENGEIDPSVIVKVRDEVQKSCRKPNQIKAFAETIFK